MASAAIVAPWVAQVSPGDLFGALRGAPRTISELPETAARRFAADLEAVTGRHLGFDTHTYPGDDVMRRWKRAAPYEWVGYYLPAPCHADDSWSGTRERLEEMGWGTAVIYVGQQTWDGVPQPSRREVEAAKRNGGLTCHRSLLGAERGALEARDAIEKTAREGFANGTVIFLDIEYMERTTPAMRRYARAWVREVLADGRFRPGAYVHTRNARVLYDEIAREYAAAGVPGEPPFWVASGRGFDTGKAPHEVGHSFAMAWQGVLDTWETWDGARLPIDINVAAVPSPSSHRYAAVWDEAALGD